MGKKCSDDFDRDQFNAVQVDLACRALSNLATDFLNAGNLDGKVSVHLWFRRGLATGFDEDTHTLRRSGNDA
jgi:hypothetical protein